MNPYVLFAVGVAAAVVQSFFSKKSSMALRDADAVTAFSAVRCTLCVLIASALLLFSGMLPAADAATLLTGALGGTSLAVCCIASFLALRSGTVVLVNMAGTAGILIPSLYGVFFLKEPFPLSRLAGLLLLGVSVWLLTGYNTSQKGKLTAADAGLLIVTFVSNGASMLSQKLFTNAEPQGNVSSFSFWMFLSSAAFLWVYGGLRAASRGGRMKLPQRDMWVPLAVLAAAIFVINQASTEVSAVFPAVLLYPLFNGLVLILSTVMSAICFREPLRARSLTGLAVGIASMALISAV